MIWIAEKHYDRISTNEDIYQSFAQRPYTSHRMHLGAVVLLIDAW